MRRPSRLALCVAGMVLGLRVVSRLALWAFVRYCGALSAWAFMPLECEFLLWVVGTDAALPRLASIVGAQYLAYLWY